MALGLINIGRGLSDLSDREMGFSRDLEFVSESDESVFEVAELIGMFMRAFILLGFGFGVVGSV